MLRTLLLSSSLLLLAGCNDSGSVFTETQGNGAPLPPVNSGDGGAFLPPSTGGQPSGSGAGGGATAPTGGGTGAGGGAAPVGGTGGTGGGSGAGGGAAPVGGTGGGAGTPGGPAPGQPVPEPATMLLVGSGVAGYSWTRRRRAKQQAEAEV